jgi:hypothetical protein
MYQIPSFLLKTPISIEKKDGINSRGAIKYSRVFEGFCRLEVYNKQIYDTSGDRANYNWIAYLNGDINVVPDSRCTFSSSDERLEVPLEFHIVGETHKILNVVKQYKPDGLTSYTKLYLE